MVSETAAQMMLRSSARRRRRRDCCALRWVLQKSACRFDGSIEMAVEEVSQ